MPLLARAVRRARRAHVAATRRDPACGEEGFILLESLVAISLITVILAALGTFTLQTTKSTTDLRARQAAAQVATTTMATAGALPPTDLITGRDAGSVNDQFETAKKTPATATTVYPSLKAMTQVSDPAATAGSGATAAVPTSAVTQTLNSVAYSVNTYLGSCVIATGASSCVASGSGITYLRTVVAVTWSGRGCSTGSCSYVTASLVNADADPVFNTNTAVPPAAPVVADPGDQISTVGGAVSLQLTVVGNTGAGSLTWAVTSGSLPAGLTLSASGLVTGAPTTVQAATALTVTATDAFGRTGSDTFTWKVVAPPTIATPATQTSTQGTAVSLVTTYTCPNSPCAFTLANAPAGLSINATTGRISGTPTTPGTSSSVTVTITDAASVSVATTTFVWKVVPRPTISDPGTLSVTVGQTVAVPITFTCPTTTCTVGLTNPVPGLGLAAAPATAVNASTSLAVSGTQTTVYITGVVRSTAVTSGTSTTWTPALTITDTNATVATSATGSWTAYAAPTIAALAARTTTVRSTPNVGLAWTCPVASCTISLTGTVPGVGLSTTAGVTSANATTSVPVSGASGTVYYTGLVSPSAVPSGTTATYNPRITITDADTVGATTSATWTITSGPSLTNPGSQVVAAGRAFSLAMSATCPNSGCSYTLSPGGLLGPSINAASGRITWTPLFTGNYTFTVTVTDSLGLTDTVSFTVKVSSVTVTVPNQTTTRPSSGSTTVTLDGSTFVTPAADGYTYTLSGAPTWLSIDAVTGLMTATITSSSAADPTITLTATSTASATTSGSGTFSWTLR